MKCNHCYPLCHCGAEAAVRYAFQEKVREFLRARCPEVREVEALLQAYAVGR